MCIYADDLLLVSTTVAGLQRLINYANHYVVEHGLSFNPIKTNCVTFGKCHLDGAKWTLNNTELLISDELNYLGAIMSSCHAHQQKRMKACRQGFYGLQASGLCDNGVKPDVAAHLWKAMLQPVLLYGTQSLPL